LLLVVLIVFTASEKSACQSDLSDSTSHIHVATFVIILIIDQVFAFCNYRAESDLHWTRDQAASHHFPARKPGRLLQQEVNSEPCGFRLNISFVWYQMGFKL